LKGIPKSIPRSPWAKEDKEERLLFGGEIFNASEIDTQRVHIKGNYLSL